MKRINKTNVCALAISIISLGFSFIKITPYEVTSETYVGIMVTALGVIATLLIGYQVLNVFDVNRNIESLNTKISEQSNLYNDAINKLHLYENLLHSGLSMINANKEINNGNILAAFYYNHRTLIFQLNTDIEDFKPIFREMRNLIANINISAFSFGAIYKLNSQNELVDENILSIINSYKELITEDENNIRKSSNFKIIKIEYERIMNHFYDRLNNIIKKPNEPLSSSEIDRIINPS